jgi:lycopene cyclase domain-containing protein
MSYTVLACLAVIAAVTTDLLLLRSRLLRTSLFWRAYVLLLFFQLLFNGVLTGFSIVRYDPHAIIGIRIAFAPVEDLAFGFALILLTLASWARLTAGPRTGAAVRDKTADEQ